MNLPKIVTELISAQNKFDSVAYANCFAPNALVFDDGEDFRGRKEIKNWIASANEKYKAVMDPVSYTATAASGTLSVNVSGNFPGSPAILKYHFEFVDGLIQSLKVTG